MVIQIKLMCEAAPVEEEVLEKPDLEQLEKLIARGEAIKKQLREKRHSDKQVMRVASRNKARGIAQHTKYKVTII